MSTNLEEFSSPFHSLPLLPPITTHEVCSEKNLGNITQMMAIDIYIKPGIIEHIHIEVTCSLDEIKIYTRLFQ